MKKLKQNTHSYFSIYDNDSFQSFILEGDIENLIWSSISSLEKLYGRKCMEFSWTGGDNTLVIGIRNSEYKNFFYANQSRLSFASRQSNNDQIISILNYSLIQNTKYMFCFDTTQNCATLLCGNTHFTVKYSRGNLNEWNFYIAQGSISKTSEGKAWFKNKFHNSMPPGYTAFADPRNFVLPYFFTCKNFLISKYLFIVITMYLST